MKRTLLLLPLLSLTLALYAQEIKSSSPVEQTVLKLEQQWEDALTHSDTRALGALYDDTLIYTHSNGKVDTKSSYIKAIQSGATRYESMKRDEIKVSVYGQMAVVTCHWDLHVQSQGNKIDMNARYLHVYVHQSEGWKLVAHQSTRIAP
jgi:ketosteroid isomerase-like protein